MMKKNYFGKIFAIATVFAGLSLTSCNKNDNAIINGQVFEPSNFELVEGGAVINANTPSEVSRMVTRLRQEILKAAENKETFTININAAALNATAGDNTLSFLTVTNGDLVVNFNGTITTDEPLVLESKGVDENQGSYGTAINKVAFNFPAGTSNIDLQLNMPKSSVTIKPTSGSLGINELSAKTAMTTLYIESGVTVNWLQLVDGNVVIKNGGKINGVESPYLNVYPDGLTFKNYQRGYWDDEKEKWVEIYTPLLVKDSLRTSTEYTDKDFYMVQNGKLLAQENGYISRLSISGTEAKASAEPIEIIIPDGVKAWIGQYWNGNYYEMNWPTVNVTGEGDATFMCEGDENDGKVSLWTRGISLNCINKLTNVTVDFTHALVENTETNKYEVLEVDTASNNYKRSNITLPINSENCTFNAKQFNMAGYNFNDDIVSSTHKNCIFNSLKSDQNYTFEANFPAQNDKRKSFTLAFDTCEFDQAKFGSGFSGDWETTKDYKGYISFANSKIGGKAVSNKNDMIAWAWPWTDGETVKAEILYTIDGVNYKPIQDPKTDKWYLLEVE